MTPKTTTAKINPQNQPIQNPKAELDSHMQKNETRPLAYTIHKD